MAVEMMIKEDEKQLDRIKELKEKKTKHTSDSSFAQKILIPAGLLFLIGIAFPMLTGIIISFRDSSSGNYFGSKFTRLNYYNLLRYDWLGRDNFWRYTYQTIFFALIAVFLEFCLGLIFALILDQKFKGRGWARATLLIPWALPTVASATIFRYEFFTDVESYGFFNSIIAALGLRPVAFFGNDAPEIFRLSLPGLTQGPLIITLTMVTAIIIDVWKTTPFISLLILAALQVVPEDLDRAGSIAGANGWQKFWKIKWPLILPGIGVAIVFRLMQAIQVYDAIVVFNDDSVYTMAFYAVSLWQNTDYGRASAVAVIQFIIIIIGAGIILGLTKKDKTQEEKQTQRTDKQGFIEKIKALFTKQSKMEEKNEEKAEKKAQLQKGMEEERKAAEGKIKGIEFSAETRGSAEIQEISSEYIKWIKIKRIFKKIGFFLMVFIMCLWCAGPFLWIILRSFRDPLLTNAQDTFELWPEVFNIRSFQIVLQAEGFDVSFTRAMINSFIVSSLTGIVVLIIGALAGYALAKFQFKSKAIITLIIFSMTSLPPLIIIIPYFIQVKAIAEVWSFLDLHNNLLGLIIPYAAFNLPLSVFVLRSFFEEIPDELWKAGKVDGASRMQIFWRILLPLTVPGLFTCFILVFINAWNELLFAQIWLTQDIKHTIPRAILRFVNNPQSLKAEWVPNLVIMAATSIATIPLVILVLIFQRQIISGITSGAVKG